MTYLRPLDILFIFTTGSSTICGFLSIIFLTRLPKSSSTGESGEAAQYSNLIRRCQKGMLYGVLLYHTVIFAAHYVDILISEANQVHFWDGENVKGWFLWLPYIGTDLALVNGITWVALLWSKLLFANSSQTNINPLLSKALATGFIAKANSICNLIILAGTILIPSLFRNDGNRISMWSTILVDFFMVLDFIIIVPVLVSLIRTYRDMKSQTPQNKKTDVLSAIKRMIIFSIFVAILCPVALFSLTSSNILKYPGRVMVDYSREEVCTMNTKKDTEKGENTCPYQSSHITFPIFLYSFAGTLISVPFLLRKDFFQVVFKRNFDSSESKDVEKTEAKTEITGFDTVNVEDSTKV